MMQNKIKKAVVTGASRGLGKAIAIALAKEGYELWLSARSKEGLNELKTALKEVSDQTHSFHSVDFSIPNDVQKYAAQLYNEMGEIGVLVNNAGIYIPDSVTDDETLLEKHLQVNFHTSYDITQALLPLFTTQKSGHIFNVCSVVNKQPRETAASYTISKFALYGYHQVLVKSMKPFKVKVTAFLPSSINTSSWDGMKAPREEFVQPEDIADALLMALNSKPGTVISEIDLEAINPNF